MAYSHSRLRKTLAVIRILTGVLFLLLGLGKISSVEFAWSGFPQFLAAATHGGAVGWYGDALKVIGMNYAGKVAIVIAFGELVAGVALLLGLAVRPVALIGMLYMANLLLATWNMAGLRPSFWQQLEGQMQHIFPAFLLFLLAIGHAGETWGVGVLYHRAPLVAWRETARQREMADGMEFDNDEFHQPLTDDVAHEL